MHVMNDAFNFRPPQSYMYSSQISKITGILGLHFLYKKVKTAKEKFCLGLKKTNKILLIKVIIIFKKEILCVRLYSFK